MQLKITWKYVVAFIALNFIMGELHEQVHINTGFFICDCYGPRDFNVWSTCEACANPALTWLATLAGPLFSCCLMWLGACWFAWSASDTKRMIGFSLLFANLPFARIFTALVGGGDEKVVVQSLLGDTGNDLTGKIIAAVVVTLICLPPILIVGRRIWNRHKWAIVSAFAIIPLLYGMLYQRMFLNRVLDNGFLNNSHILGTPDLILYHFCFLLIVLFIFRKSLVRIRSGRHG